MAKNECCHGCTKRYLGCHSNCEDYAKFDNANKERRRKLAQWREDNSKIVGYLVKQVDRNKRKR